MPKRLWAVLFPESEASFDCGTDLAAAMSRLSAAVRPSVFRTPFREAAIGQVTAEKVSLRRYRPWIRNDFRPEFVGAFVAVPGPRLVGRFRQMLGTRLFAAVWIGFTLLWTLTVTVASMTGNAPWMLPLAGAALLAFGFGMLAAGRAIGGGDVDWLTNFIEQNLREPRERA